MKSVQRKSLGSFFLSGLTLLVLTKLLVWHSRGSVETVAIGAVSWTLTGGYLEAASLTDGLIFGPAALL